MLDSSWEIIRKFGQTWNLHDENGTFVLWQRCCCEPTGLSWFPEEARRKRVPPTPTPGRQQALSLLSNLKPYFLSATKRLSAKNFIHHSFSMLTVLWLRCQLCAGSTQEAENLTCTEPHGWDVMLSARERGTTPTFPVSKAGSFNTSVVQATHRRACSQRSLSALSPYRHSW